MGKRIMAVDDSRFVVEQIKHILSETDYDIVSHCSDGESAIENYGAVLPDLVMMDIILPGMDGIETLKALLVRWPDACVIVVTSLAFDEVIEQAESAGARGFICKPFDRVQVLEAFEKALSVRR